MQHWYYIMLAFTHANETRYKYTHPCVSHREHIIWEIFIETVLLKLLSYNILQSFFIGLIKKKDNETDGNMQIQNS